MLDQLLNLVKEHAQDAIVNNSAIPNEHNEAAVNEATNAISGQLSQAVSNGNLQDVLSVFSHPQNIASNPIVGNIVSQYAGTLGNKFGVDPATAQGIASQLIPQVVGQLAQRTNDPNNSSFDINGVISHLSGGNGTGGVDFGNVVSQLSQGGNVDLGGIASQVLGGGGGGIGGLLGGLLK